MAAWELSSWLALIRTFQVLGALAGVVLNGFVAVMIYIKDRDLLTNMVILELLICIALCYTLVSLTVQHSGQRSKKSSWLMCFLGFDLIACGMACAILFFLRRAGLPANCVGLALSDGRPNNRTEDTWSTSGFSDEKEGSHGEMDKFCAFERSYFFISIGLVLTYLLTAVLTILRIRGTKRSSKLAKNKDNGDDDIDLKTFGTSSPTSLTTSSPVSRSPQEQQQQQQQEPHPEQSQGREEHHPSPPSEGIITRNTSIRSTVTSSTASHGRSYSHGRSFSQGGHPFSHGHSRSYSRISTPPAPASEGIITRNTSIRSTMTSSTVSHGAPSSYRGVLPTRKPIGQQQHAGEYPSTPPVPLIGSPHMPQRRPVLPPRPTPPYEGPGISSSGPSSAQSHMSGMGGMGQGFVPIPLDDHDDDNDDDLASALVADGMQHQHRARTEQHAQFAARQRIQMPMLPEDEQLAAEHALVTDGGMGGDPSQEPMLPPYEPGDSRMAGHDGEDNETRLSEYVKGQTRAQDMKDSGRY